MILGTEKHGRPDLYLPEPGHGRSGGRRRLVFGKETIGVPQQEVMVQKRPRLVKTRELYGIPVHLIPDGIEKDQFSCLFSIHDKIHIGLEQGIFKPTTAKTRLDLIDPRGFVFFPRDTGIRNPGQTRHLEILLILDRVDRTLGWKNRTTRTQE